MLVGRKELGKSNTLADDDLFAFIKTINILCTL